MQPKKQRKPPKKLRKLKKLEKEARATRRGEILGEFDAHSKKPLMESLKEHLGHWIDNIDPLEIIACFGTTFIIHDFILRTPKIVENIASGEGFPFLFDLGLYVINQVDVAQRTISSKWVIQYQERTNPLGSMTEYPYNPYANPVWSETKTLTDVSQIDKISMERDPLKKIISANQEIEPSIWQKTYGNMAQGQLQLWLISFALAYILVHNAGALLGLIGGGIDKAVPFLMGVAV